MPGRERCGFNEHDNVGPDVQLNTVIVKEEVNYCHSTIWRYSSVRRRWHSHVESGYIAVVVTE